LLLALSTPALAQKPPRPITPEGPGYEPAPYGPGGPPPVVPTEARSPAMTGVGIGVLGLGGVSVLVGSVLLANGNAKEVGGCGFVRIAGSPECVSRNDQRPAGAAFLVGGLVGVAAGITLIVIGSTRVPIKSASAASSPKWAVDATLGIGPGHADLKVAF
jgi:hypothetical protein